MRTSHTTTHTQPPARRRSVWLRLLVLALLLGGLIAGVARWAIGSAEANELDAAGAGLQQAQAKYLAKPNKENRAAVERVRETYAAALTAVPAAAAQNASQVVDAVAVNFGVSAKVSDIAP